MQQCANKQSSSTHSVAHESEEEEQQRCPAFEAHEALCMAVEAVARLQMARMVWPVWVGAGHRVVDLERLLGVASSKQCRAT
jgi:hypothetical protein